MSSLHVHIWGKEYSYFMDHVVNANLPQPLFTQPLELRHFTDQSFGMWMPASKSVEPTHIFCNRPTEETLLGGPPSTSSTVRTFPILKSWNGLDWDFATTCKCSWSWQSQRHTCPGAWNPTFILFPKRKRKSSSPAKPLTQPSTSPMPWVILRLQKTEIREVFSHRNMSEGWPRAIIDKSVFQMACQEGAHHEAKTSQS